MKGWSKAILAVGIVAVLAAYFGSPLLSVRALVAAAEMGDEAALERLVDFPALRESLKEELTARLMEEARTDPELGDSALGGLGLMFGPMLVSGAVDMVVTAPSVATMIRSAKTPELEVAEPTPDPSGADRDDIRRTYAYRDLNTFVLGLTDPDRPTETLKLLLRREGLFSWRLVGIDLPEASAR